MKKIIYTLFLISLLYTSQIYAEGANQGSKESKFQDAESKMYKIREMFPENWIAIPWIDPKIPQNYIADSFDDEWVLWGLKEDLEAYSKNPSAKINSPIFRISYSLAVAQTGPTSFGRINDHDLKITLQKLGLRNITVQNRMWGIYPIKAVKGTKKNKEINRSAWIGINYETFVMLVNFVESPNLSCKQNEKIWNEFITMTTSILPQEN